MVTGPRGQFARLGTFLVQQPRKRDGTKPHTGVVQKLAPGWAGSDDSAFHFQYTYTNSLELNSASAKSARARVSGVASLGCGLCSYGPL